MEIKCLRLVTGDDIVGDVVAETDKRITVRGTLGIMAQQTPQGIAVGLIPFPLYADSRSLKTAEYDFEKSKVLLVYDPNPQLEADYRKQFSGLIVPENSGKIQLIT